MVPSIVTRATNATSASRLNHAFRRAPQANPPNPKAPGKSRAQEIGRLPLVYGACGVNLPVVPAACVCTTSELTGGQAFAGEPDAQLVGVVGRISTLAGLNAQEAWFGSPEQESVTNMGAESAVGFTGSTVRFSVPALPAVSTKGSAEGATGVKASVKLGVPVVPTCTVESDEVEAVCVESPLYTARKSCTPPGSVRLLVAWPVALSTTPASSLLPSKIAMEPVAGNPFAPVTFTCVSVLVCPPWSLWETVSDVSVEMPPVALSAMPRAPAADTTVSAIPSPATKLSRRQRRFMPLTCTCSKSTEESRNAKLRLAFCPNRRTLLYPARVRWGHSAPARICPEPAFTPTAARLSRLLLDATGLDWRVPGLPVPPETAPALCFFFEDHSP